MDAARERTQRLAGFIAGAVIGIVPAGVGFLVPDLDILVPAGAVGAVTGALLGARYGGRVRTATGRRAAALAVQMAAMAVLLGDLLVCAFIALNATSSGLTGLLFALVVLPVMGIAVVGLPALGIALGAGVAWVLVMRALPGRWIGDPG